MRGLLSTPTSHYDCSSFYSDNIPKSQNVSETELLGLALNRELFLTRNARTLLGFYLPSRIGWLRLATNWLSSATDSATDGDPC